MEEIEWSLSPQSEYYIACDHKEGFYDLVGNMYCKSDGNYMLSFQYVNNNPKFTLYKNPNTPSKWNGVGLPPVGKYAEVGDTGKPVYILAHHGNAAIYSESDFYGQRYVSGTNFKPVLSMLEQAEQDFKKADNALQEAQQRLYEAKIQNQI